MSEKISDSEHEELIIGLHEDFFHVMSDYKEYGIVIEEKILVDYLHKHPELLRVNSLRYYIDTYLGNVFSRSVNIQVPLANEIKEYVNPEAYGLFEFTHEYMSSLLNTETKPYFIVGDFIGAYNTFTYSFMPSVNHFLAKISNETILKLFCDDYYIKMCDKNK